MIATPVQNWLKDAKALGPTGAITAICLLLVLIVTGIIPTPLMKSQTIIEHVAAHQDEDRRIINDAVDEMETVVSRTNNLLETICEALAKGDQSILKKCYATKI